MFPHRSGQEVELEARSDPVKDLAWRDFTLMFSWENTLHILTLWSETYCFRVLQLVFFSHGQPSVTCWEVPGSDWFPLPFDSCTFQWKGDTFTEKRKFPRTQHGHGMQGLFITEEQCYYKEKVCVNHLTRAWHRRGTEYMWDNIVVTVNKNDVLLISLLTLPTNLSFSPYYPVGFGQNERMQGWTTQVPPLLLSRGFGKNLRRARHSWSCLRCIWSTLVG